MATETLPKIKYHYAEEDETGEVVGLTRDEQHADWLYVTPDDQAYWCPDGYGRIWYADEDAALEDVDPEVICYLDRGPEDY